ncbi:MAG: hypothetical protein ACLVDB_07425 [Anaeromassilibacillus sp.]
MLRIVSGFPLGVVAGTLLAALTSVSRLLYDVFHPMISIKGDAGGVLHSVGVGLIESSCAGFTAFLMVLPVVWGNVSNGIAKTTATCCKLWRSINLGLQKPSAASAVHYAVFHRRLHNRHGAGPESGRCRRGSCQYKASIGGNIYNAKIYIETADLFAWTAVVIVISVLLEKLMMRLMKTVGKKYNLS